MNHTARFRGENPRGASLHFGVHPADRDHLELETGEVFQNPRYAKIREKAQSISASLTIREALDASDDDYNRMSYLQGTSSDYDSSGSEIYFQVYLPHERFAELVTNVRGGILPSTIQITLLSSISDESDPMKYSWEPDGSGDLEKSG